MTNSLQYPQNLAYIVEQTELFGQYYKACLIFQALLGFFCLTIYQIIKEGAFL